MEGTPLAPFFRSLNNVFSDSLFQKITYAFLVAFVILLINAIISSKLTDKLIENEKEEDNLIDNIKKTKDERSKYNYVGVDKLYPDHKDFIENNSWTSDVLEFYFKDKQNRIKRSDYFYAGSDKLKPTDELFFENNSWKVVEEQKNREELALGNFKESFLK